MHYILQVHKLIKNERCVYFVFFHYIINNFLYLTYLNLLNNRVIVFLQLNEFFFLDLIDLGKQVASNMDDLNKKLKNDINKFF